jgi:hypothetical protein
VRGDVAVAGETIAAIATPGALSADSAKHLIDATGHIVMPGGPRTCISIMARWEQSGARRCAPPANLLDK